MTITNDALDYLAGSSGPSAKFDTPGDKVKGKVLSAEKRQSTEYGTGKPKFYDDGNPMWEVVITVDTGEDDGNGETTRRLFARGVMLKAIREALRETGAKLEVGGELAVQYTGNGEASRGMNPPKLYRAKYTPASPAAVDLDDL